MPEKALGADEENYVKAMQDAEDADRQLKDLHAYYRATIQDMKGRLDEKEAKAQELKRSFLAFKREVAKEVENVKGTHGLPDKVR